MSLGIGQEIVIRPFVPGDSKAFHDLNMHWIAEYFQVEAKDIEFLSDPEGMIINPGGAIFVSELGNEVVGCVALMVLPDLCYQIAKMAVSSEAQGQGIGRSLLDAAIRWAREHGAARLCLGSNARLTPALHLYESVGFRHLPPERRPTSPYARADVFMELMLTPRMRTIQSEI